MEYCVLFLALMLLFSFSASSFSSDQQSLLALRLAITSDPNKSLPNWKTSIPLCNWTGVACSPRSQRVVNLSLPHMGLDGTISLVVGNLSALQNLDLGGNALHGRIPCQLGRLSSVKVLQLGGNQLEGNIPTSLSGCRSLGMLSLHSNLLQGNIPVELSILPRLWMLDLGDNNLTGRIPSSLANLSALIELDLSGNNLHGPVPPEIAMLTQLLFLYLYGNHLSGNIPSSLGNISSLVALELANNSLAGPIPAEIGMLINLQKLLLFENQLSGTIPTELGMLTDLQELNVWGNELSGSIPSTLGNCSKLQFLDLRNNQLSGIVPIELGKLFLLEKLILDHNRLVSGSRSSLPFLIALTNCSHLEYIKMSHNHLTGVLPPSVGHLSPKLSILELGYNRIMGRIPQQITNLTNLTNLNLSHNLLNGFMPSGIRRFYKLERLYLSGNSLEGSLPEEIGEMKSLGLLDVSCNKLSGRIPSSLARLKQLRRVFLHHNHFSGEIPNSLQSCENLELVDISHNDLGGNIPGEFMASLNNLRFYLNMSWNELQGPLPIEISKIVNAQAIDISGNQLHGMIPQALANCIALEHLNLSHNALDGFIPDALWKLQNLESIDLSFNFLSGTIPTSFRKIKALRYLNVCFNNLTGQIPEGGLFPNSTVAELFMGNEGLCGPKKYLVAGCPKQDRHKLSLLAKVMISAAGIIVLILCSLIVRMLWCQRYSKEQFDLSNSMFGKLWRQKFTYKDLVIATNGFDERNLLGMGRFGSVYKGVLRDNKVVAIKVLNLQNEEVKKSFKKECNVLGRTRHRNLIRVISVCSYPDFKAFILEFAMNGSLEKHLYPNTNSNEEDLCGFNLGKCLNIATDVAHAMEYLHHDCPVQVVHCDLKPGNVLLDDNMTALVTDFGISKLTAPTNSMDSLSTTLAVTGSIGYIAPEYGLGGNISVKGDIYSYGILLLEMVTKKRPTDAMFVEDLTLQKWVSSAIPHRLADIVDSMLLAKVNTEQNKCLVSFIQLGLLCTNESPQERPTMRDVGRALEVLRSTFMGGTPTASYLTTTISNLVRSTNTSTTAGGVSDSQSSSY